MADLFGAVWTAEDTELDDLDLSDSQWGYGDPVSPTCSDVWDLLDLEKLFKLIKEGEKKVKKFNTTRYPHHLEVARLPRIWSGEISIRILPRILDKVFEILTQFFDATDRICIASERRNLAPPIYLTMRRLSDCNVLYRRWSYWILRRKSKLTIVSEFTYPAQLFHLVMERESMCTQKLIGSVSLIP